MREPLLAVAAALVTAVATLTTLIVITPAAQASGPVRVVRWVDGDTLVTNYGTVRLIGVDTPERGRCGYRGRDALRQPDRAEGVHHRVGNPASVMNRDRYGRLLRYVNRGVRDLSAAQITHGARAGDDSRDGYQWHPRQAWYRRLDATYRNYRCAAKPSAGVSGSVAPVGRSCPAYAPIKGNASSIAVPPSRAAVLKRHRS